MRASRCLEYGPPEGLVVVDIDEPVPGAGEVVVDVHYAAVNFPDVLVIASQYQVSVPTPFTPGSEFSGVVAAVGEGCGSWKPGDRVFGSTMNGAFAEKVSVGAEALHPLPPGVDIRQAAAFWVTHATAYHSLRSIAEVVPGETVLVLGAAGGVGIAAVTLARHMGATVIAAASSDEKLDVCRLAGAHHSVNYSTDDLRARLRTIAPDGIDVVIDPVGGAMAEKALRALRWRGRFVTVGFASGDIPRIPLNLVLLKGCVVRGFEIRTFGDFEPELAARDKAELTALLADGLIDPHVSAVYPLEGVSDALRHVADRRSTGKVLVDCRSAT